MPGSASASRTSRIARCRSSSGYFRSADIVPCSWWLDRLHQTRCETATADPRPSPNPAGSRHASSACWTSTPPNHHDQKWLRVRAHLNPCAKCGTSTVSPPTAPIPGCGWSQHKVATQAARPRVGHQTNSRSGPRCSRAARCLLGPSRIPSTKWLVEKRGARAGRGMTNCIGQPLTVLLAYVLIVGVFLSSLIGSSTPHRSRRKESRSTAARPSWRQSARPLIVQSHDEVLDPHHCAVGGTRGQMNGSPDLSAIMKFPRLEGFAIT